MVYSTISKTSYVCLLSLIIAIIATGCSHYQKFQITYESDSNVLRAPANEKSEDRVNPDGSYVTTKTKLYREPVEKAKGEDK